MIIRCPNCGAMHIVSNTTTDFICTCDTGTDVIDNDDIVVIGDWEDFTGSGSPNQPLKAGLVNMTQDQLELQKDCFHLGEKDSFGKNKATHRQRQHEEYMKIK